MNSVESCLPALGLTIRMFLAHIYIPSCFIKNEKSLIRRYVLRKAKRSFRQQCRAHTDRPPPPPPCLYATAWSQRERTALFCASKSMTRRFRPAPADLYKAALSPRRPALYREAPKAYRAAPLRGSWLPKRLFQPFRPPSCFPPPHF